MIKSLRLAELVEDMALYPRHTVDSAHVGDLMQALLADETLPPVVVDEHTRRIVDGVHRVRAARRVFGADASISVDVRTYPTEEALLLDAIRLNAAHGRRLDKIDKVRCVVLAQERQIDEPTIAAALHMPVQTVERLRVRVASGPDGAPGAITGTTKVALKNPLIHLEGQTLSADQVRAADSAPGTSYLLIIRQLREALCHGLLNLEDARILVALGDLRAEMDRVLAARV